MTSGPLTPILEPSLRESLVEEGRRSLATHRDVARGSAFPRPKEARPTFFHGFLLPFSLVIATLRDPTLGRTYLKLICGRALVVGLVAIAVFQKEKPPDPGDFSRALEAGLNDGRKLGGNEDASRQQPVHVHLPGVHIDLDPAAGQKSVKVLGQEIPTEKKAGETTPAGDGDNDTDADAPKAAPSKLDQLRELATKKWTWLLWFIGVFSLIEAGLVFVTRRYDDWISFHASILARTRPEEAAPRPAKIAFEPRWVAKKLKRRIRGYVVFGGGIPFVAAFYVLPKVGETLFTVGLSIWGWYWLTVFTAAKSAHAWEDEHVAPSPYLIRELRDRPPALRWLKPLNLYARLWAWATRSVNAPAMMFERAPAPFLGLALARVILSLPGLYLVARPIIPVAAGRLCAETDPGDRFSGP